mmetsp:Transcript_18828/g.63521  ORF Transcript_18828/g.63521 Transcript_18828/m.63521 type:complete len:96 (-) Transcript_18828:437-724(-)
MRHIIDHLRHPASLQAKILSRGLALDSNPELGAGGTGRFEPTAMHVAFRETSAAGHTGVRRVPGRPEISREVVGTRRPPRAQWGRRRFASRRRAT